MLLKELYDRGFKYIARDFNDKLAWNINDFNNDCFRISAFNDLFPEIKWQDEEPFEPLHTVTGCNHFGLVVVKEENYNIVDIGLRMLTPRKLARAQGFPDSYALEFDYIGRKYSVKEQVKRIGNSVVPVMAKALVSVNLVETMEQRVKD